MDMEDYVSEILFDPELSDELLSDDELAEIEKYDNE